MAAQHDSPDIERIAAEVGLTRDQVRAVLAAARADGGPGQRVQMPIAAAWAGAGVALVAMFVFVASTEGFSQRPDGKLAAFATGVIFSASAVWAGVRARRSGFVAGEQLALSVAALISPVITWSALWLLGLWPGGWVDASPFGGRYWDSGGERPAATASLAVFLTPLLAAVWVLRATGAGLALGVGLLAGHGVIASVAVIAGIPAPGAAVATLLAALYTAGLLLIALRLETHRRAWATWVHPFVPAGSVVLVASAAEAFGSTIGVLLAAALLAGGALLTVTLWRGLYLAAVIVGGALWDFWLYEELALGPVAGLALTLSLGLGSIMLALRVWRRRRGASSGPPTGMAPAAW